MADTRALPGWGQAEPSEPRFDALVVRLQALAARDFAAYRRRVVLAGLLGYAVVALLLLLPATLFIVVIVAVVDLPPGGRVLLGAGLVGLYTVAVLRLPRGDASAVPITVAEAPALHDLVARVANASGVTIDEVCVTAELNASVQRRVGTFGRARGMRLRLGVPLLFAVRTSELEAIVTHELGHVAARDERSTAFCFATLMRVEQLRRRLEAGDTGRLLRRFFGWYAPWFSAHAAVLSRRQELGADQFAARLAGAPTIAAALIRVRIAAPRMIEAAAKIREKAARRGVPAAHPWRQVVAALQADYVLGGRHILQAALSVGPDPGDSHPTLAQRLAALGQPGTMPPPLGVPAATVLLGDDAMTLVDALYWPDESA